MADRTVVLVAGFEKVADVADLAVENVSGNDRRCGGPTFVRRTWDGPQILVVDVPLHPEPSPLLLMTNAGVRAGLDELARKGSASAPPCRRAAGRASRARARMPRS